MKWPRDKAQGFVYALIIIAAWCRDHVVLIGWWFLIVCAISADAAAILIALESAHRGLHA